MSSPVEDRMPPSNLEAEQVVLGCCMMESGALVRARQRVSAEDFWREQHRCIFDAICTIDDAGDPVDVVTVGDELRRRNLMGSVGGAEYLTRLIGEVPTTHHVIRYSEIVRDCSVKRQAIAAAGEIQSAAYAEDSGAGDLLSEAMQRYQRLGERLTDDRGARHVRGTVPALQARAERDLQREPGVYGARFGIGPIDYLMGGMEGYSLVLWRALTKGFKSVVGLQTAGHTARVAKANENGKSVLVYLLEAQQVWEYRMLAWLGGFNSSIFKPKPGSTKATEEDVDRVGAAIAEYETLPILVSGECRSISDIELDVRQKAMREDVCLVIVDHLHRVTNDTYSEMRWSLWDTARRLDALSVDIGAPVLCLAQAIRRQDGEWHTKESSSVDDEASVVFETRRGDKGMERHVWQSCDWLRVVCPTARLEPPFDMIGGDAEYDNENTDNPPLYCDIRKGDLRIMGEQEWTKRGYPTREQQLARQKVEMQKGAGYAGAT